MTVQFGETVRVAARLTDNYGKDVVNVYHWINNGVGVSDDEVMTGIQGKLIAMYTLFQPALSGGCTFMEMTFQNVTTGALMGTKPWTGMTHGGASGDAMPAQDCLVAIGRTLASRVVGRKFFGPFYEGGHAAGVWSSTITTMVASALVQWAIYVTTANGAIMIPGVARYTTGGLIDRFIQFSSFAVTSIVRAQRRRQQDVGG